MAQGFESHALETEFPFVNFEVPHEGSYEDQLVGVVDCDVLPGHGFGKAQLDLLFRAEDESLVDG